MLGKSQMRGDGESKFGYSGSIHRTNGSLFILTRYFVDLKPDKHFFYIIRVYEYTKRKTKQNKYICAFVYKR